MVNGYDFIDKPCDGCGGCDEDDCDCDCEEDDFDDDFDDEDEEEDNCDRYDEYG